MLLLCSYGSNFFVTSYGFFHELKCNLLIFFCLLFLRESINLSGAVGLKQVIDGARYFLNKENVNFKVTEYSRSCTDLFEDDEISIKPVLIYPGIILNMSCGLFLLV